MDALPLPELLALTVDEALERVEALRSVTAKLQTLHDLGLGYLTLGEATPALSGGEAQRLKLGKRAHAQPGRYPFRFRRAHYRPSST